jgi:hypothetical protein
LFDAPIIAERIAEEPATDDDDFRVESVTHKLLPLDSWRRYSPRRLVSACNRHKNIIYLRQCECVFSQFGEVDISKLSAHSGLPHFFPHYMLLVMYAVRANS